MAMFDRVSSSASSQPSSPSPSVREEGEAIEEDTLFVAVSRQVSESESVLRWALENRGDSHICIIHVHQPDKLIPTELGKFPVHRANKQQIEAHRVNEREALSKKLDKHLQICRRHGVRAAKIYIEMDSIQDGIVKLIGDKKIGKLVMGAASDRRYSKNMIEILSPKAKYVHQHAPGYCHIWFVCNKLLIHTREATENFRGLNPVNFELIERLRPAPSYEIGGLLDGRSSFDRDRISDEYEMPPMDSSFSHSTYHSSLSGPSAPDLTFSQHVTEQKVIDAWILDQPRPQPYDSTPSSTITREVESPFLEELENVTDQKHEILEELQSHISLLESRIEKSDLMVEQLERRLQSAMEQVENYKKERDNAIKQVEELRNQLREGSPCAAEFPRFYSELPLQEIEKATNKFDPLLKIGEDAYGNIYKGVFNFEVAVKVPHPNSSPSSQIFQQEVESMSKLRHPNIVNLISICPESQVLIYEYCAKGNLEDQLNAEVEGPPLLWQIRIRIAFELCIVLMFLHSQTPHPIIHGDIRDENIHLDSKYTCKLNDFKTSSAIANGTYSLEDTVKFYKTESRPISYAYTDPEYFATGELTTKSDVYSYGIILLRLLTGKQAMRLIRQVKTAADTDELSALLDPSAGWPLEQAQQLAALALRCCEMTSSKRPDFEPDIWKVLESMKGLCD